MHAGTLLTVLTAHRPEAPPATRRPANRVAALTGLAVVGLLWLVASARPAAAETKTVNIVDFSFGPGSVQVAMGPPEAGFPSPHAHVTFVNNGAEQHNVTFSGGAQSSPSLNPNAFYDAVFVSAGTFSYQCTIHPAMQGSVTVTPLPTTTTAPPTTEAPTTAPPTTAPPVTTGPVATTPTTRPRTTTTTRPPGAVAAATTTTAAPTTTAATAAPEATTAPVTEPATTTTTTTTTDVGDGLKVAAPSEGPAGSPVAILLVVVGGGIIVFAGRALWLRRHAPGER